MAQNVSYWIQPQSLKQRMLSSRRWPGFLSTLVAGNVLKWMPLQLNLKLSTCITKEKPQLSAFTLHDFNKLILISLNKDPEHWPHAMDILVNSSDILVKSSLKYKPWDSATNPIIYSPPVIKKTEGLMSHNKSS